MQPVRRYLCLRNMLMQSISLVHACAALVIDGIHSLAVTATPHFFGLLTPMSTQRSIRTVILNGSLARPSKTRSLLDALHAQLHTQLHTQLPLETLLIDLVDLFEDIGTCLWREQLPERAMRALQAIETADFLIVGAPVFRGSVPGLFKHLFDLLDTPAMADKPVLLAATGGSQRHALVIEHQLRPLLSFFQTLTLPVGVYASAEDFQDGRLHSAAVDARIALAVQTTVPVLQALASAKELMPV